MAIKFFKDNKIKDLSNIGYLALATILDKTYPIGCYFETSDVNFNPNEEFVGTWVQDTKGLSTVGAYENNDTNSNSNSKIYLKQGESIGEVKHKLTINEMPSHTHQVRCIGLAPNGSNISVPSIADPTYQAPTGATGGDTPHNNVQPSIGVYRWHRVS